MTREQFVIRRAKDYGVPMKRLLHRGTPKEHRIVKTMRALRHALQQQYMDDPAHDRKRLVKILKALDRNVAGHSPYAAQLTRRIRKQMLVVDRLFKSGGDTAEGFRKAERTFKLLSQWILSRRS